jgi:carbamoyltransferase
LKVSGNKKEAIILGISCFYHDSSAVLLIGDKIIAAVQEERFTRKKFDNSFPEKAIKYCLKSAHIKQADIDCIAFYEEPYVKLDRIIETQAFFAPLKILSNYKRIRNWIRNKLNVENQINKYLPAFTGTLIFYHHHLSHAASAFFPSQFKQATILTIDGVGEWACASIARGEGSEIEMISEQRFPHSVGLLYSAFTQYIGFKVDSGEYKLMGLAPYGNPIYADKIKEFLVDINPDGSIKLNTNYFNFMVGNKMINNNFEELFGGPSRKPDMPISQKEMDIASSIQNVTEEIILKMVDYSVSLTGIRNLCIAGGVALNCVANGKILRSKLIDDLWIQPASGDSGGALGAAYLAAYEHYQIKRDLDRQIDRQRNSLLGMKYTSAEIEKNLNSYGFISEKLCEEDWSVKIAKHIATGKIVGMFQGQMEYGPRALGNRSILGDPRHSEMQKVMNLKIKYRESFRPFAPMVLNEKVKEWFDIESESPYMLLTADVKKDKRKISDHKQDKLWGIEKLNEIRSDIPAVTHIDYSARIQTVTSESNPKIYQLLKAFDEITNCPILVNTSFNIRGEPIVCTPFDALKCFMNTEMDVLVMEDYILLKKDQGDILKDQNFKSSFDPD